MRCQNWDGSHIINAFIWPIYLTNINAPGIQQRRIAPMMAL